MSENLKTQPTEQRRLFSVMTTAPGIGQNGDPGVIMYFSPSAITTDINGDPVPGAFFLPYQARIIAFQILAIAEEMEARARLGLTT